MDNDNDNDNDNTKEYFQLNCELILVCNNAAIQWGIRSSKSNNKHFHCLGAASTELVPSLGLKFRVNEEDDEKEWLLQAALRLLVYS